MVRAYPLLDENGAPVVDAKGQRVLVEVIGANGPGRMIVREAGAERGSEYEVRATQLEGLDFTPQGYQP